MNDPVYDDAAPLGGDHGNCWADYGIYEEPLEPARWVHNLEHGAVVVLHACEEGCPAELEALRAFVDAHERTILTPAPGLATRFAIVAWGHRLLVDCLDIRQFETFYSDHFNQGREDVASGAPQGC